MESTFPVDIDAPFPVGLDVLAVGLVGSRLYGMAGPDSDADWKGAFMAPTRDVLSLRKVRDSITWAAPDPDCTLFEIGRLFALGLAANPTALEILNLPVYQRTTWRWSEVVANRDLFLSARARMTYGGFGRQMADQARKGKRTAKSIRHAVRVIEQGIHLLETGEVRVVPPDPEYLFGVSEMGDAEAHDLIRDRLDRLRHMPTVLPPEPDSVRLNDLLADLRIKALPR